MEQLPLCFEPRTLHRRQDPDTSVAAAHSAKELRSQHHAAILGVFDKVGLPLAAEELAGFCDLTPLEISRRLAELRRAGLIDDSGERHTNMSGRQAVRYRRTEQ